MYASFINTQTESTILFVTRYKQVFTIIEFTINGMKCKIIYNMFTAVKTIFFIDSNFFIFFIYKKETEF